MAFRSSISVPTELAFTCRFRPAISSLDGRIAGKGLTGTDLHLWLTIIDALQGHCAVDTTITIPNVALAGVMGQINPQRVTASLDRLKGYDVFWGNSILPMIKGHARNGTDWVIAMDVRYLTFMHIAENAQDGVLTVPVPYLRKLSSRYSTVLWLRFLVMEKGKWPPDRIEYSNWDGKAAFRLAMAPVDLGWAFGTDEILRDSEIRRNFYTKSAACPLRAELAKAMVKVETVPDISIVGRKVERMTIYLTKLLHDGIGHLVAQNDQAVIVRSRRNLKFESKSSSGGRPS